jgi:hypothetical protein
MDVPPFSGLDGAALDRMAGEVDLDRLARLLEEAPESEGDRLRTALELAPRVAARVPSQASRWERLLRRRISDGRTLRFDTMGKGVWCLDVGHAAFEAYGKLWADLVELPEGFALAAGIPDAVRRGIERGFWIAHLVAVPHRLQAPAPLEAAIGTTLESLQDRSKSLQQRHHCWAALKSLGGSALDRALAALVSILSDRAEKARLQEWALEQLMTTRPSLVHRRVAEKSLRRPIPPVERLHGYQAEERGQLYGLQAVEARLEGAAATANPEEILWHLENPDDLPRALSAILLVPRWVRGRKDLAARAEAALLGLVGDGRIHEGEVFDDDTRSQKEKFGIAFLALTTLSDLAAKRPPEEQAATALSCLRGILSNPQTAPLGREALRRWPQFSDSLEQILADAVSDRARAGKTRIAAYEILSSRNASGLRRAADALVAALREPEEDREVQAYASTHLASIQVEAVSRLKEEGYLRGIGLPPLEEILAPDNGVKRAAVAADPASVLEALGNEDLPRALAALLVAPEMAGRVGREDLAGRLLRWVPSPARLDVKRDRDVRTYFLGDTASQGLLQVLAPGGRPADAGAVSILFRMLESLLEAKPLEPYARGSELSQCCYTLRATASTELRDALRTWARDPTRSPVARGRALREAGTDEELERYAVAAVLDPAEEAGFRALVGARLLWRKRPEIEAMLDLTREPWGLRPGARADLPISSPPEKVPDEWLFSTVCAAGDPVTLRTSMGILAGRHRIEDPEEGARARDAFRSLVARVPAACVARLREVLDGPATDAQEAAARLLALLGRAADEDRVARGSLQGLWVPFEPGLRSALDALMSAMDSTNANGKVFSALDPYILAGYGPERAVRVRAKSVLELARNHAREGRMERARKTCRWAVELDPSNRDAADELGRLDPGGG